MTAMNTTTLPPKKRPVSLRIAVVTETCLPEINGVSVSLAHMLDGLLRLGHHIDLVRPRQSPQEVPQQKDCYRETLVTGLPIPGYPGLKTGLPARGKLLQWWAAARPDIVHIVTEGPLGWSALSAARKLNIPVSSDFHTNFHSYTRHYGLGWLYKPVASYLRYLHNRADCTLVPTDELQRTLTDAGYTRVQVVARGIDTVRFNPGKRSALLRSTWGASEEVQVVMLVSRLAAEKNLPLVIRAFRAMQQVNPYLRLVMVGDGPARAELQVQHPDVIFTGMKTGEELAQHYASGDIFLYPSLTETYGNVTVEAMASGLAVVAYDYAAARQHIRPGVNGLLAEFAHEEDFVHQAVRLAQRGTHIQDIRQAARHTVEELTWDRINQALESVLLACVANHQEEVKHDRTVATAEADR